MNRHSKCFTHGMTRYALAFLISIWMFASPVFYPVSEISAGSKWIFMMNPIAPVLESYRRVLLGIGTVEPLALGASIAVTVVILLGGIILFQRAERTAVDTL